jgi:hypothetical protein
MIWPEMAAGPCLSSLNPLPVGFAAGSFPFPAADDPHQPRHQDFCP